MVAVAITVAVALMLTIAVSYLFLSLPAHSTRLEIIYAQVHVSGSPEITLAVKNLGSTPITVSDILLNGAPIKSQVPGKVALVSPDPVETEVKIQPGEQRSIVIRLNPSGWSGGEMIQLTLITDTGHKYYAMLTLP